MRVKQNLSDFIRQADLVLLGLCTASTLFGILVIASATRHTGSNKFVVVQSLGMVLGIVFYFLLSAVDVEDLPQKWKWILGFNVALFLLLRTPLGVSVNGNLRNIKELIGTGYLIAVGVKNYIVVTVGA